ncbi:MAG: phosphatidate cytidylyltransferase [Opitutaceae bacterium]|nr:phosphatidate cytidylyltransferase [Opitutaceae bacterium]
MAKRILSTVLLWTLVLLCVRFFGTIGGVWLVTAISVLTQREFYAMLNRMGLEPFDRVGLALGAAIMLAPCYLASYVQPGELLALAVIVFSVRILGEREPHNRLETLAWSLFGVVYVPFMLQFLVRVLLTDTPHARTGLVLGIWLVAVSKFCDVGALLAGLALGRHQLAPNISPKKTWEGAVGGLLVSAGVGAGLAWACRDYLPAALTPALAALIALPIAALAIVSDLIESIIKRRASTKDTSQSIPGIGGVFDLSDSLILTAPMGYALFHLL